MSRFTVGLTGGIGTGKSAVSDRFAAKGIIIADTDVASRNIVEPGRPALSRIREHFGDGVIDRDGRLDRAALRRIVFADAGERQWLESLTHPLIMDEMRHILESAQSEYAMLVLSAGAGRSRLIDRMLVVDAPEERQIERVMTRDNNTREQVLAIIAAQPDRQTRMELADDVIVNDGDLSRLDAAVDALHRQYLKLARRQYD